MAPDFLPSSRDTLEIEPSALHALLDAGQAGSIRLIDCREADEFAICKLPGAQLVPLSRFPDAAEPLLQDAGTPVVVYCHHGMRSAEAAGFLRARGLAPTFSLRGGIDAWSREIDPSVARY
ncbi:hypothetical protein BH23VER1_BH23VER1_37160 [soil metagenome]